MIGCNSVPRGRRQLWKSHLRYVTKRRGSQSISTLFSTEQPVHRWTISRCSFNIGDIKSRLSAIYVPRGSFSPWFQTRLTSFPLLRSKLPLCINQIAQFSFSRRANSRPLSLSVSIKSARQPTHAYLLPLRDPGRSFRSPGTAVVSNERKNITVVSRLWKYQH